MAEQQSNDLAFEQVEVPLAQLVELHRNGASRREVRGAQYDAGLAWVWFPVRCGGLGVAS